MTWPECAECHNSNILELHFELCEHTMSLSLKWHQKLFLLVLVAPSKQVFIFWIRTESILEQSQHIIYDVAQNILSIHGGNQVNEFLGWEQQESGISWTLPKAASWGKSNWSVPLKTKTKPQMYTLKPWAPNNEDSRCEAMQPRQWAPVGSSTCQARWGRRQQCAPPRPGGAGTWPSAPRCQLWGSPAETSTGNFAASPCGKREGAEKLQHVQKASFASIMAQQETV